MSYKNIPFGTPEKFNVVIEIPRGSRNKYEYDESLDAMKLNFVFTGQFRFLFDYGYIPEARGGDGDFLDAFVLSTHPISTGTVVKCRAIGFIELIDRGKIDNKILAVAISDPHYQSCHDISDLTFDYKTIFGEFFKELGIQKNKTMEIKGYGNREAAIEELASAHKIFR